VGPPREEPIPPPRWTKKQGGEIDVLHVEKKRKKGGLCQVEKKKLLEKRVWGGGGKKKRAALAISKSTRKRPHFLPGTTYGKGGYIFSAQKW